MTTLIVDASVWVAAADPTDAMSDPSRDFLSQVAARELPIALPDFAKLEIACALARRLHSAEHGRSLADQILGSPLITTYPLNRAMLQQCVQVGTWTFLRAGDAVYTALAKELDGDVVTWDRELIDRAGALTPLDWMLRAGPRLHDPPSG